MVADTGTIAARAAVVALRVNCPPPWGGLASRSDDWGELILVALRATGVPALAVVALRAETCVVADLTVVVVAVRGATVVAVPRDGVVTAA